MEETNERYLWFAVGYLTAIAVEILVSWVSRYLSSLPSSGVVVSMNGTAATEHEEKQVAETIEQVEEHLTHE